MTPHVMFVKVLMDDRRREADSARLRRAARVDSRRRGRLRRHRVALRLRPA